MEIPKERTKRQSQDDLLNSQSSAEEIDVDGKIDFINDLSKKIDIRCGQCGGDDKKD
jgi:hypothetical protein